MEKSTNPISTALHQQDGVTASTNHNGSRYLSARTIPVPITVSPELSAEIAKPSIPPMRVAPKSNEEWRKLVAKMAVDGMKSIREPLMFNSVKYESTMIGGVKVFIVTPESIADNNHNRLLINTHGGAYVFGKGESGLVEAIPMAYYSKIKVIAVDYRMPPDHPFPAAQDDVVAVYKEVIKTHMPENIGFFGASAGGGLTAATILKLKEMNLPLPGAISLITPWADLSKTGDTYFTNEDIDGVQWTYEGILEACAKLYAGSHNLKDPLISPVYGDFSGFPPTILTSGTRDLFLSCTVRMHRKLRQARVEAELHVFEGMSHAQDILVTSSPESRESFEEQTRFFQKHLGS